jgi:hypothetical protein
MVPEPADRWSDIHLRQLTPVVVQQALDEVRAGNIDLETAVQWVADMAWAEGRNSGLAEGTSPAPNRAPTGGRATPFVHSNHRSGKDVLNADIEGDSRARDVS